MATSRALELGVIAFVAEVVVWYGGMDDKTAVEGRDVRSIFEGG